MRPLNFIDKLSGWTSAVGIWMVPILAITVFYDVFIRYVFREPTFWAYEISWMLYSANFLLGLGYALRERAHVRVDILVNQFPCRVRLILEVLFLLLLLLFCCVAVWHGSKYALTAWKLKEGSHLTIWAPPIYPIKTMIPLAFLIFGLQSLAELVRTLKILMKEE
jgi:TRAP-type mannitol/chloroaromatic compound transport system permease small subunit